MSVVQQTVYVTGLSDKVTEQDLVDHFSNIGPISQVKPLVSQVERYMWCSLKHKVFKGQKQT